MADAERQRRVRPARPALAPRPRPGRARRSTSSASAGFSDALPKQLSGGMAQRAAARAGPRHRAAAAAARRAVQRARRVHADAPPGSPARGMDALPADAAPGHPRPRRGRLSGRSRDPAEPTARACPTSSPCRRRGRATAAIRRWRRYVSPCSRRCTSSAARSLMETALRRPRSGPARDRTPDRRRAGAGGRPRLGVRVRPPGDPGRVHGRGAARDLRLDPDHRHGRRQPELGPAQLLRHEVPAAQGLSRHPRQPEAAGTRRSWASGPTGPRSEIPEPVDVVDVFRRPDAVPGIVDAAIAIGAKVVWLQLGVRSDEAAPSAEAAGLTVIQDRCMKIEYGRLSGRARLERRRLAGSSRSRRQRPWR